MYMRNFNETEEQKALLQMDGKAFDEFMCARFPEFFAQRKLPATETCMCWGFEIGRGWQPLLFEMCKHLEAVLKPYGAKLEFTQIKSKLGSLRAYYDYEALGEAPLCLLDIVDGIVYSYEELSNKICSELGIWYDEKINVGCWIYDVSLDGFKFLYKGEKDIDLAEAFVKKTMKQNIIKRILYYLDDEKTDEVLKIVQDAAK